MDLTRIDGVDVFVAQTMISEVGLDMSPWKTEAHFASWLGLCPDNRISGDKVLARGTRHVLNRAATALRLGASTLLKSQTYLGAQYRRLRSKLGAPKAITAMAHRLARLVYRMLKYGQHYVDKGAEYYERRNRQQQIEFLTKKAAKLGLQVTPAHVSTYQSRSFWGVNQALLRLGRRRSGMRGSRGNTPGLCKRKSSGPTAIAIAGRRQEKRAIPGAWDCPRNDLIVGGSSYWPSQQGLAQWKRDLAQAFFRSSESLAKCTGSPDLPSPSPIRERRRLRRVVQGSGRWVRRCGGR